jgi:hypothetical protein
MIVNAHDVLRNMLENFAVRGLIAHYEGCAALVGLSLESENDRATLGRILGEISRESEQLHGYFLSAIVHHKGNTNSVGGGFWDLMREYEIDYHDQLATLMRETNKVFEGVTARAEEIPYFDIRPYR